MVNVQWKENEKIRYENLLSEKSVEDFVESIKQRGCTDIKVTSLQEIRKLWSNYHNEKPLKR